LIKQGAKLVTSAEDVIEELPTPVRAMLVQAEAVESGQRNLLAENWLNGSQKTIYDLLNVEEPRPVDDIGETSGLNSTEVLATLFDLEMKGLVRQIPGKQLEQGIVVNVGVSAPQAEECTQRAVASISCKRKKATSRLYKGSEKDTARPGKASNRIVTGYKGTHGTFISYRRVAGKGEDDQ
jgi:DNA-binding MarR family transcriptional regulator